MYKDGLILPEYGTQILLWLALNVSTYTVLGVLYSVDLFYCTPHDIIQVIKTSQFLVHLHQVRIQYS